MSIRSCHGRLRLTRGSLGGFLTSSLLASPRAAEAVGAWSWGSVRTAAGVGVRRRRRRGLVSESRDGEERPAREGGWRSEDGRERAKRLDSSISSL